VSVEAYGPPEVAVEVVVRDATSGKEVGRAASRPGRLSAGAVVRFDPRPGHAYAVRVRRAPGAAPRRAADRFHLVALGGRLQYATREGSIPFPGDGAEVTAVGAVDGRGRRLAYSSCGGGNGKPDLVAEVPFPSNWRAAQPFAGTSAAAPQAAGLAAVVWSRWPGWSAAQVGAALRAAARAPGRAANPAETGRGVIHLP
jgi:subtilisin family serine protease